MTGHQMALMYLEDENQRLQDLVKGGWENSGVEVYWAWERLHRASTKLEEAEAMVEMHNAMSDLASWLPGYDPERGCLRGDGVDA